MLSVNVTVAKYLYSLSLHDALPICVSDSGSPEINIDRNGNIYIVWWNGGGAIKMVKSINGGDSFSAPMTVRTEEQTSELQSPYDLVCRHLLEKEKRSTTSDTTIDPN